MTDIVERLIDYAKDDHERGCQGRCYDCSCGYDDKRDPLMGEAAKTIASLRVQNIQMQAALGYAICAEDERHIIPSNPYSCGVCDAANKWPNRRTETLDYLGQVGQLSDEIERLRAALRPFAWYADNLVPQIDKICGDGFYKSLADARAALEG